MHLIAKSIPRLKRPCDDSCRECCRGLSADDRVFMDEERRLFCSVKCATAWRNKGGP